LLTLAGTTGSRPAGSSDYNREAMKNLLFIILIASLIVTGCNKPAGPAATSSAPPAATSSRKAPDAVQQKLQESSGAGATDCGRLDMHAAADQLKTASDCAMQASQGKHPFYVAYDMPGMSIGVAGNGEGKLFTVQSQGTGSSGALTTGACPSQLRVASSGRISCFSPGDMGSMGGSHAAGAMTPGMANPHGATGANPHPAPKTK